MPATAAADYFAKAGPYIVSSLVGVAVTLALFLSALRARALRRRRRPNPASSSSMNNFLNQLTVAIVLMPLAVVVPQLFAVGRDAVGCRLLHHGAGSATFLACFLVQAFFLLRSNQIAAGPGQVRVGRALLAVQTVQLVGVLAAFNAVLETRIVDDGVCVALLPPAFLGVAAYLVPFLVEVVLNARFVWLVLRTRSATRPATDTSPLLRLVCVTCAMSVVTLGVDLVMALVAVGAVPVADPAAVTLLIVVEATYHCCAVAWPAILIAAMNYAAGTAPTGASHHGRQRSAPAALQSAIRISKRIGSGAAFWQDGVRDKSELIY